MRIIIAMLRKEFLQIFRNPVLSKIIFLAPVIQLVVLTYAADFEVRSLQIGFVDRDGSHTSAALQQKFTSTDYFEIIPIDRSYSRAMEAFESDELDAMIEIGSGFEADMMRGISPSLSVSINAINSMKAGVASSYIAQTISDFSVEQLAAKGSTTHRAPQFQIIANDWYNPQFDYKAYMISGILCVLITVIGVMLTTLNIVREKEVGTIEQLNVTPISKSQFIIGKLLPFGIIGMVQLAIGLLVATIVFDFQIEGSLALVFATVLIYTFGILGIGFLISTMAETQAQAMFVAMFFMFLMILLSGLFTPIESMPIWAQWFTRLNPVRYIIESMRMLILKGSPLESIGSRIIAITLFAIAVNALVILRYSKRE